jgi:hypothetical protein
VAGVIAMRLAPAPHGALTPYRFRVHRLASYAVLLLVGLHISVMAIGDPFMLDYLGWMMPVHILVGVVAALALLLAVATREPSLHLMRRRIARQPAVHAWIGLAAIGATLAHVLLSASKLVAVWRPYLLAAALAWLAWPALRRRLAPRMAAGLRAAEPVQARELRIPALLLLLGLVTLLLAVLPAAMTFLRQR